MINLGLVFSCDFYILFVVYVFINIVFLLYNFIEFCYWFYVDYEKVDDFWN